MKILKKTLCIFLSVVVLSLSVGGSYLSADHMEEVNATALATVATVSLETIIEVVALLAVTGLAVGLISEWTTMDMQSALEDFHDWLHDNISVLNEIGIDGTSALKEWAVADEWTVIEGTGGGEDPDPSSDPSGSSGKKFNIPSLAEATELAGLGSVAAYDYLNRKVTPSQKNAEVVKRYFNDKIADFSGSTKSDPITSSLKNRYIDFSSESDIVYSGSEPSIDNGDGTKTVTVRVNYNFDSGVKIETFATQSIVLKDSSSGMPYKAYAFLNSSGYLQACFGYLSGDRIYAWPFDSMTYTRYKKDGSIDASGKYSGGFLATGGYSCNLPVFTSNDDLKNYLKTGDDSACINKSRKNNYIDTDDEYGWASTADISPSDLAAANPDAAENLVDKDVKIIMQTPDILVPYVGEQILLIDFQDYAKYFLWVRTFLAFSISFGFVLWVVKQFKVVYTVN